MPIRPEDKASASLTHLSPTLLTIATRRVYALAALPSGLCGLRRLKDLDLRANAPLVVHGHVPAELLLSTPVHRLELDPEMVGIDGLLTVEAADGDEARQAYLARRKERIDKELHAKERGGEIHFGQ